MDLLFEAKFSFEMQLIIDVDGFDEPDIPPRIIQFYYKIYFISAIIRMNKDAFLKLYEPQSP